MPPRLDDSPERADADAALRRAIGRNLQRARMLIDENRSRIAEDFGVTHAAWWKWEAGERYPDVATMVRFCERWRFTMDFLYRGVLAGLDERLRNKLYRAYPELLPGSGAEAASSADAPPPEPAEVPAAPATGRKRPGRRHIDPAVTPVRAEIRRRGRAAPQSGGG